MISETAWEAGEFSATRRGGRLLFGRMYEDAEIESRLFRGRSRVFCIASAGCTALRLARDDEDHEVVACDINPVQLAYARQRGQGGARKTGAAERVMAQARRMARLAGWHPSRLDEFLRMSDPAGQLAFWKQHLDTRRFRHGFDLLLSPRWLRLVYAPPFLAFLPADFGALLRARLERGIARHPNAANPFAWALFHGSVPWPEPSRSRAVEWVGGDAAAYLESCPPAWFDAFTLSNILDGATSGYRVRLAQAVRRAARPGALVVMRSFAEPSGKRVRNCAAEDRSLLWGRVEVLTVLDDHFSFDA
jgi:S-adenosylmethionine:diacylglycerol 3-amino-3-carboxypropyl transferase